MTEASLTIEPLPIVGAHLVRPVWRSDDRGALGRVYCARAFAAAGLNTYWPEATVVTSPTAGTVRGLHWQEPPAAPDQPAEIKLVRCARGRAFDVIVDLRRDSPSFLQHATITLIPEDGTAVYIPAGVAHGVQTLQPDTELSYMMGAPYAPDAQRGIRYDDPTLAIAWPMDARQVSARDLNLPSLDALSNAAWPPGGPRS